jgi:hypothetical protein
MACAFKRCDINIGDTANLHVVKRQSSDEVNCACSFLKIGFADIARLLVQDYADIRFPLRLREFDVDVTFVDLLFEVIERSLGACTGFNRMIAVAKPISDAEGGGLRAISSIFFRKLSGRISVQTSST